jgi:hypothetical protein
MMPSDLILRTRLQVLRRNLEEVKGVIASVESVREGLQRILLTWDTGVDQEIILQKTLRKLIRAAKSARDEIRQDSSGIDLLNTVVDGLGDLEKQLFSTEISYAVRDIASRSMDLRQTDLRRTIEDFLVRNANQHLRTIRSIEEAFERESSDRDDEVRAHAADRAWTAYLDVLPKAQDVFAEYVDFLAGLALRDGGYDGGICRIADELVHAIGGWRDISWNSLTIPARREALEMTMARIIRIGFPEWSFWALPLVAYGFGSVLVGNVQEFTDFTQRRPTEQQARTRVLLADALATYVMGPAYACALMLLRLDPAAPEDPAEAGLTVLRAQVVLAMLRRLSKETDEHPHDIIEQQLHDQWDAALAQTHPGDEPPGDINVQELVDFVTDQLYGMALPDNAWPKIDKWSSAISEGQALQPDDVNRIDDGLRHVLNAAWLARLRPGREADHAELVLRAYEYWEVIDDIQHQPTAQPGFRLPTGRRR